jgi:sucrose synthase
MARLDRVKNMTGLVEWFGKNSTLRKLVNLVVVAGFIDSSKSKDREEIEEIEKMHGLIRKYNLNGDFRWICAQKDRVRNGELYRYIADTKGAFIQVCISLLMLENAEQDRDMMETNDICWFDHYGECGAACSL